MSGNYFGVAKTLGTYHNAYASGNPVDGYFKWPLIEGYKDMPINQTNEYRNGAWRSGGSWLSYVSTVKRTGSKHSVFVNGVPSRKAYSGRYVSVGAFESPKDAALDELMSELNSLYLLGAEGLNLIRPAQPDFSLAVSLAELREVPSMLKHLTHDLTNKIRQAVRLRVKREPHRKRYWESSAGEWYLAHEFGWVPLFRDIQGFARAFESRHKRLDQLIRDEGKPVRRRRKMSNHDTNTSYQDSSVRTTKGHPAIRPVHTTGCYRDGNGSDWGESTSSRTWVVGQARYFLPKGPRTQGWKNKMYRRIMGGRITPSVAYNLIPWSWLVDYFTDLGEFVDAISPGVEDLLIWDYAYIMRTKEVNRHVTRWQNVRNASNITEKVTAQADTTTRIKMRCHASPFGFGFKDGDLNIRQLAILGALGLSRLP